MNKRRRFGAKRRRRNAKLKQMWLTGSLSSAQLFTRLARPLRGSEYSRLMWPHVIPAPRPTRSPIGHGG